MSGTQLFSYLVMPFLGIGDKKIFLFTFNSERWKLGPSLIPFRQSPGLRFNKIVDFNFELHYSVPLPHPCFLYVTYRISKFF